MERLMVEMEQDHLKFLRIVRLQFSPRWYVYICIYFFLLAEERIYELESQFGELVKGVHKDLQNDKQKLSELPDIIRYKLPQRLKGIRHHISYKSITEENFPEFFNDLEDLWNFLDYDLLKSIIMTYKNPELIDKLRTYEQNVGKFCAETTVSELIKYWMPRFDESEIPDKFKECVTELSLDPNTCKVKALKDIQKKLRHSLPQELAMAAFYICDVKHSSVRVVWLVWTDFISPIMDTMRKVFHSNPNFVTENKISVFSLDNVILYSTYNDKVRNCCMCNFTFFK